MTSTTTSRAGSRRPVSARRRTRTAFAAVATAALLVAGAAATTTSASATVTDDASFEFDDGNLANDGVMDWNDFDPVTWSGTAPYRTGESSANGWDFTGLEDDEASNADTGFGGGTKQDDSCPQVKGSKAPNKDDLRRVYVTSTTIDGDVFLGLSWTRIPQNNTSASAHIGFEFNQGETPCAGSSGLVERTAGDMLVVYDFEGGDAEPTITLRRWVTSGACEVGSNSPPCWGPSSNLTALGFAVAEVNTGGPVTDALGPDGTEAVGASEFGEAGINLTDAGVFGQNVCAAFGKAYAVSRSSGNSAQAQMKDLVGPGDINIANCGTVIIHKTTDPSPDPTDSTFGYTTTGGLTPATFDLKDGETQDYGPNVFAGNYSVTETDPTPLDFELQSLDCSASDTGNGSSFNVTGATVSFDLKPNDTIECTYTNELKQGAIQVTKTRKHAADGPGDHPHAGVTFTLVDGDGATVGTAVTDANGEVCFDELTFGGYDVTETLPTGYAADGPLTKSATVDNKASCDDDPFAGETLTFANTPLTDIDLSASSQVSGGTHTQITCVDSDGQIAQTANVENPTVDVDDLLPGTYTCTIVIDP